MMTKLLNIQASKLLLLLLPFALQACAGRAKSGTHQQQTQPNTNQTSVRVENRQPEHSVTGFTGTNVEELLTIIRDDRLWEEDQDRVARAMYRLGELRAVEAINDLTRLLTYRRSFESDETRVGNLIEPTSRYPAIGALYGIGEPSLPALVRVIEEHEGGSRPSDNAIFTVKIIYRETPGRAVEYLREVATRASSPEAARRLSEAAQRAEHPYAMR